MDKPAEKIEPILLYAERELRDVIAEAAKAGDYEGVDLAREVAARIKAMVPLVGSRLAASPNGVAATPDKPRGSAARNGSTRGGVGKKGSYPRFQVRKGTLWKFGWSKSEKKEYVHKIPKEVFEQTVAAIGTLTQNGVSPLAAEQIIEQVELAGHSVPIYQVYVALAFLREHNVVRRNGRDGYLVIPEFAARAEALWSEA
jgi:hypothetical protein